MEDQDCFDKVAAFCKDDPLKKFEGRRTFLAVLILLAALYTLIYGVLLPFFRFLHADSAMFASLIANDMGGYPLAMLLAENEQMGLLSGCITSSMLGCTLVFSLPVGMGIIQKEDHPFFIRGL
ncbi:MAG: ethanolamine utilization protein EutH, partial [Anaerotignum sp.]|nr:ethanolamine utilization protein EutH [Anaerotignum sp.]